MVHDSILGQELVQKPAADLGAGEETGFVFAEEAVAVQGDELVGGVAEGTGEMDEVAEPAPGWGEEAGDSEGGGAAVEELAFMEKEEGGGVIGVLAGLGAEPAA